MGNYQEVQLEAVGEGVAVLTLKRAQAHNALNGSIREEIADAAASVAQDSNFGALVLIGDGGRAFSVGADLKDPRTNHSADDFEAFLEGDKVKNRWYEILTHYPKGVVAAVSGYTAGSGVQLALTADVLIGTPSVQFWIPQVGLGLAPHVGSLVKLARIMGQQRMLEMILTGRRLSAAEALSYGLLSKVVEYPELLNTAVDTAAKIAAAPRLAIELTKQTYFRAIDMTWEQAMSMDRWKSFGMFQTADKKQRHAEKIAELTHEAPK